MWGWDVFRFLRGDTLLIFLVVSRCKAGEVPVKKGNTTDSTPIQLRFTTVGNQLYIGGESGMYRRCSGSSPNLHRDFTVNGGVLVFGLSVESRFYLSSCADGMRGSERLMQGREF